MIAPEYVAARAVLLDALAALRDHLPAIVLVGAQAVYLHTGAADLVTAPMTTDADIALAPGSLRDEPKLADALRAAGFVASANPGSWRGRGDVAIDLMVPEALSGAPSRRRAHIPGHGSNAARRTHGLEPALVDNEIHELSALDPADPRRCPLSVAGPVALLVAKIIKIDERRGQPPHRQKAKDGLDVLRLLRVLDPAEAAGRLRELEADGLAGPVIRSAITALRQHGADRDGPIATLAATAVVGLDDEEVARESTAILIEDLLGQYAIAR
ncbi:hypothetical protein [Crossiella sp. CA198]|uniref:hypothetical protein n=1 Tax=Crossiella sp. CA198 TaxID=3455607 RepID=UPI003F8D2938